MKQLSFFLVALLVVSVSCVRKNTQEQSENESQKSNRNGAIVYVQGHQHELLTKLSAEGKFKAQSLEERRDWDTIAHINPAAVSCWAGCPVDTLPIDTAYLLVKWTNDKIEINDSIFIWAYLWNSIYVAKPDTFPVTKYSIDMIRAIANTDKRFSVLLQQTGGANGYAVGGFGYNFEECKPVALEFKLTEAEQDTRIAFEYTGTADCSIHGQLVVPDAPDALATAAISTGTNTGIIEHPFNANYGYPAYDYDYWVLTEPEQYMFQWQSGWNNGYWSFFSAEGINGIWNEFYYGVSSRELQNQSVDGFVFCIFSESVNMEGTYTPAYCDCN